MKTIFYTILFPLSLFCSPLTVSAAQPDAVAQYEQHLSQSFAQLRALESLLAGVQSAAAAETAAPKMEALLTDMARLEKEKANLPDLDGCSPAALRRLEKYSGKESFELATRLDAQLLRLQDADFYGCKALRRAVDRFISGEFEG